MRGGNPCILNGGSKGREEGEEGRGAEIDSGLGQLGLIQERQLGEGREGGRR